MFPASHFQRLGNTLQRRMNVVLRYLLVLTVWQGPVLWCHCHGTLANAAQVNSCDSNLGILAEHLQDYHSQVDPFANLFFGWHFHVDLPTSDVNDPGSSDEPIHDLPVAGEENGTVILSRIGNALSMASQFDGWHLFTDQSSVHDVLTVCMRPQPLTHFLDSFAPTLALPLRLSRSLL